MSDAASLDLSIVNDDILKRVLLAMYRTMEFPAMSNNVIDFEAIMYTYGDGDNMEDLFREIEDRLGIELPNLDVSEVGEWQVKRFMDYVRELAQN